MLRIDSNIIWVIVNLLIFYFLMRKLLFKRVMNMIEKRKELIDGQFADAKNANDEALQLKEKYEDSLKNAKAESAAIVEQAHTRAEAEYNQIVADAHAESRRIVEQTNKKLEKQQEQAMQDVESQIGVLAMAAAAKIIGEQSGAQSDAALYNEFLKKNGKAESAQ